MVSISSIAAESRAAGVIRDFQYENEKRAQISNSIFSAK
jgi:hypothetical protein